MRRIAWYLKITENVFNPVDSVRHASGEKVVDNSMFADILSTSDGESAMGTIDREYEICPIVCIADCPIVNAADL